MPFRVRRVEPLGVQRNNEEGDLRFRAGDRKLSAKFQYSIRF